MFQRTMTVLNVSDVTASIRFYEKMGFVRHGIWDDPKIGFAIIQRGQVSIGLDGTPNQNRARPAWWTAYIYVADARAVYQEFKDAGVPVDDFRDHNAYGCLDFDVVDPGGYRLAFGQDLDPTNGPGLRADD